MTQVYEIAVMHGYIGLGYYGYRAEGIICRNIRLPEDYRALGETVFFSREDAENNLETVKSLIAERNNKKWDAEAAEERTRIMQHSHALNVVGSDCVSRPQDHNDILHFA